MLETFDRIRPQVCGATAAATVALLAVCTSAPGASLWLLGALIIAALAIRLLPGRGRRPAIAAPVAVLLAWPLLQIIPLPAALQRALTPVGGETLAHLAALGVRLPGTISLNPQATLEAFLLPAGGLAAFLLAARAGSTARGYLATAAILVATGAALSVVGFAQFQRGLFAEASDAWARGTFVHRGHFAAFAAACAWLAGGTAATLRLYNRAFAVASGCAAAVCAAAVLLSESRMAVAVSVLLAAAVTVVARRNGGLRWAPAAGVLLAAAVVLPLAGSSLERRFAAIAEQRGDPGREAIWRDTAMTLERLPPTGAGLGAFPWAFRRSHAYLSRRSVEHAHSDYLEWLVELGVPQGLSWCLILGFAVCSIGRGLVREPDEGKRLRGAAALLGCLALLLHAAVDSPLHAPATAALAALLLGLAAGSAGGLRSGSSRATTAVLAASLCAWALAAAGTLGALDVNRRFQSARQAHLGGDLQGARDAYRATLTACPTEAAAWLGLAELRRTEGDFSAALSLARTARVVEPHTYRVEWPLAEAELAAGATDSALARLRELLADLPDLRPAALQMAWRYGVDLKLIEAYLIAPEGEAVGEYLAFLVRTGNRELAVPAYRRLALDQSVAVPQPFLDYLSRHLPHDFAAQP